ncbi:sigma-70 family RNA polymerase sigma factor [Yeosuana sp. MJ-SS3]|uniref:Sigma-70 family RNA polymerase sigma factor n=1 Tax=Gilvirhabdus luticola TaxID=3079858 RepID=A0ABU3U5G9_9FLAO|nr:sigma-70 family RNA polymerase sigma factor [Yeosuana sp. MJ-SS3]MDU8885567.1 sigma-70 family RNA polymerase sigma factor [Yeosuana sp. MJ-SS3]
MVTTFSKYFLVASVTQEDALSSNTKMTTTNEQLLINQIINGDTKSFSVLVYHYKDLVYSLTLRMLKNKEEAEEVSQDVFIKIYKSLHKFKGDSKLSTWIYKIVYNSCLDRLKQYKKEYVNVPIDEFTENKVKSLDNALDNMIHEDRKQTIQDCINRMSSDDSFLLTLYYFEEHSLDEISKIVGLTANNVKVKLFRSRKKLASILRSTLEPEMIRNYD